MRGRYAALLAFVMLTAWRSYAYFHIDENFQVLQWTWVKLGLVDAWTLPMEHTLRMRSWLQPALYWALAQVLPTRDEFQLAFAFRLATGIACLGALLLFARVATTWVKREDYVRGLLLCAFLPYLFVRTSSETLSMAAFTAAFALALEKRFWIAGVLVGIAFEARFQTAILVVGLCAWLVVVARERRTWQLVPGALVVIALEAPIDRWGYGEWCFPPYTYFHANLVEGVAGLFGAEPPFAYLWMLPANVFAPVVLVLMVSAVVAWIRHPKHPLTWTTLPFFLLHNLLAHKEERFLFPLAIFATAFVPLAFGALPRRAWTALAVWGGACAAFLAVWPLGWNHHVRFQKYVHDTFGAELHAVALPDFDLGLPAFHPRIYDVRKESPQAILAELDRGPLLLIADEPVLRSGDPALDARATRIWTELPAESLGSLFARYDAWAKPPLKPFRFRTLYRIQ